MINTGNWLSGKKVVISPLWITDLGWDDSKVQIDLSIEAINVSPPYDPNKPVDADYAGRLHDHYGRARYDRW